MRWAICRAASRKPRGSWATKSSSPPKPLRKRPPSNQGNMNVPILKQRDYLISSVQSVLSDQDLVQLRDDLADRVGQFRSRGVIVDVTVLDVIDSFATRTLRAIAHMLRLRGAETVIVGIQPD